MHHFLKPQNWNNHIHLEIPFEIVFIFDLQNNQYLADLKCLYHHKESWGELVFLSFYSLQGLTTGLWQQKKGQEMASETLSSY